MHIPAWLMFWIGGTLLTVAVYILTVRGQLYCFAMFCGHGLAVLKDEVVRSVRVIKEALSRKEFNSKYPGHERDGEDIF